MKIAGFIGVGLILAGAALWLPTSADASQASTDPRLSVNGPTPPPVVVVGTKEGAKASANKKADGRLTVGGGKPSPKKSKPDPIFHRDPLKPVRKVDNLKNDFRLNIGICGRVGPDGTVPGPTRCQPFVPGRPDQPTPPGGVVRQLPRPQDVRWEQILAEYRDVLFPGLSVKVQPVGRTLVNLDTIVYTDESKVSVNTVTLLGFPVVVEATPMSYTWNFGDGKTLTTTTPGKAYPSKEITHKYLKRGNVSVTLTTNYAARYNVADTGWQYVDGTVPITGPATALTVREAVPVLVDPQR